MLGLSIIMPAHDNAATIARAVGDALRIGDEVIVVDTGSGDDTAKVAEAAGARVVQQARAAFTFAAARNAGAAVASGDWLLHLDTDERLDPGYLPVLVQAMAARDLDIHDLPQSNRGADGTHTVVTQRRLYRNGSGLGWVGHTYEWVYPLGPAGTLDVMLENDNHGGSISAAARALRSDLMTTEVLELLHADLGKLDGAPALGQFISRCRHLSLHGRALFDIAGLTHRAWDAFQRCRQQGEATDAPRLEMARLLELAGDGAAAHELYTSLPAGVPASATYLAHLAACSYAVTRDVDTALAAIDVALAQCPCAIFLLTRGSLLVVAGRRDEAAASIAEALRRLPALRAVAPGLAAV